MRYRSLSFLVPLIALPLTAPLAGQGPAVQSPGSTLGQTTRFSTDFNPAIGFVVDAFADYLDADGGEDGLDGSLRLLELTAAAHVDPDAWAYVVLTSEELESLGVDEAAIHYTGFDSTATLRAGRFFVDFGKQMQLHLDELRTLERPLVLREYLGEELAGTGVQLDHWFAAGDETPVRWSIGVFASLLGEGHHEEEGPPEPEAFVPDRKDVDELSFTGRLTSLHELSDHATLQLGASGRHIPEFAIESEADGLFANGFSNTVLGLDATYARAGETGLDTLTAGVEWLSFTGDLAASVAPGPVLDVVDDTANGAYAFVDYGWNGDRSVGAQVSWLELPEDPSADASELDLYYTHYSTEYRRIRFGVTRASSDLDGDETRVYVQFTNFFGSHAHGLNW
jgi:hypothetical protein